MPTFSDRGPRQWPRVALAALAALLILLRVAPWHLAIPGRGLESSWQIVIAHAAASGWQWGRDIAFTYGPLGYLRSPLFDDALVAPAIAWNTAFAAVLFAGIVGLLRKRSTIVAVVLFAVFAFAHLLFSRKGAFGIFPLLAALLYFRDPDESPGPLVASLVVTSGIFGNVYLPSLAVGAGTFALMDISRAIRRRVPVFSVLFVAAVLAGYLTAGQNLAQIPAYARSAVEIVRGYDDAMSLTGATDEIVVFIAASLAFAALVVWLEWTRSTETARRDDAVLVFLALALFWFVSWKGGFVRHDAHSLAAWASLSIAALMYGAMRWPQARSPIERAALVAVALGAAYGGAYWMPDGFVRDALASEAIDASVLKRLTTDPIGWRRDLRAEKETAYAAIRDATTGLEAKGTVDMIGYQQADLLAHGLDYRPQPVFQGYAAYTPGLVEMNREHLRSDRAAGTLFVSSMTIDNRYPLHDAGMSIRELMTRYRADDIVGDYVRMTRRSLPLEAVATDVLTADARLGQWVSVPAMQALALVRARVEPRLRGRALRLALKLPPATMTVKLVDGSEITHRVVPAILADGFALSPYATTALEIAAMASGRVADVGHKRVVAVRFDADPRLYRDAVAMRVTRIDVPSIASEPLSAGIQRRFDRLDVVARLADSAKGTEWHVEARGVELFAHAPAKPRVALRSIGGLRVAYGLYDGAWSGDDRTDGVCFRVRAIAPGGAESLLHERCLLPTDHEGDRGPHVATIAFESSQPLTLVFETDCRASCAKDWSYWRNIDVLPGASGPALERAPRRDVDRYEAVARLAQSVRGTGQVVEARGTLLFAHAPAKPDITLPHGGTVEATYGIFEGAWKEGRQTDGVCFRIVATSANESKILHERCLAPLERETDKSEQRVSVSVPGDVPTTLVFETDCRASCANDWSFWKDIDITP